MLYYAYHFISHEPFISGVWITCLLHILRNYPKYKTAAGSRSTQPPGFTYPGGFSSKMNIRQARLILNVRRFDDEATIKQKHRVMMISNHPDSGGSTYLATKINEAKQCLLNE